MTAKLYAGGIGQGHGPDEAWQLAYKYLLNEVKHLFAIQVKKNKHGPIELYLGDRESVVYISRTKGLALKVECNPRKLGPAGFKLLTAILSPMFNMKEFKKTSRLRRVDAAIDIVGVDITELVASQGKGGKTWQISGDGGKLETLYVNRKNGSDGMRLTLYDRRAAKLDEGKEPPFGQAPVTRVEVVTPHFGKGESLFHLLKLPDRFSKTRVGFWRSQKPGQHGQLEKYLALRPTRSPEKAVDLIGLATNDTSFKLGELDKLRKAESVPEPDLVSKKANWQGWISGLEITGLKQFLES